MNGKVETKYYKVYKNNHFLIPQLQEIDNKKTAERKLKTRHDNEKKKIERIKLHKIYIHSTLDHPSYLVSSLPLKVKLGNHFYLEDVRKTVLAHDAQKSSAAGKPFFEKLLLSLLPTSILLVGMPKALIPESSYIQQGSIIPISISLKHQHKQKVERKVLKEKGRIPHLSEKFVRKKKVNNSLMVKSFVQNANNENHENTTFIYRHHVDPRRTNPKTIKGIEMKEHYTRHDINNTATLNILMSSLFPLVIKQPMVIQYHF